MSKELTIKEKNDKIKQFIFQKYQYGELDNSTLVELIILAGSYLNLKTIPDYAKEKGMTYSGVKNHREIIDLFGIKFVVDNN